MQINKGKHDDEYYVRKAQAGDQEALSFLLQKYHNLAHYIALKICHCDADAEDIVQESFIEVGRSIRNLQEPKYFKAWLNKIIFSKSTKLFRKNKDVNMSEMETIMMTQSVEKRRYMLPREEMKFQSDAEVVRALVDQLPEKLRVTLYLMYFEQLSVKEIAIALSIPEGTVKSRISNAKAELRTLVTTYEAREQIHLDFKEKTLESVLGMLFAKEYGRVIGMSHSSYLGRAWSKTVKTIPPTSLAILTACTIGVGGISYFTYDALQNQNRLTETQANPSSLRKEQYTFPKLTFQGQTIDSEKKAYQALIKAAHCHVEIEAQDTVVQEEIKQVYQAMKNSGGVYYELLHQRSYADNFE